MRSSGTSFRLAPKLCIGLPLRDILRARRAILSECMIQDEEIYERTALYSSGCVYQSTVRWEPTGRLSQCERPGPGNDAGTRQRTESLGECLRVPSSKCCA